MTVSTIATASAKITVLGAGGRAGRAIIAEAVSRGHTVAALVRVPSRHNDLSGDQVTIIGGDALDAQSVSAAAAGSAAIISAVTPFTEPPKSFDTLDADFYARAADATIAASGSGTRRLIMVSLFATLATSTGVPVMDDPNLFPPRLRPFAAAHLAGVDRLARSSPTVDWLALAPSPNLSAHATPTGAYKLGDHTFDAKEAAEPLSYSDLALAIVDQIEEPTYHREHVAVYGT